MNLPRLIFSRVSYFPIDMQIPVRERSNRSQPSIQNKTAGVEEVRENSRIL
jgi:hypothetical protein